MIAEIYISIHILSVHCIVCPTYSERFGDNTPVAVSLCFKTRNIYSFFFMPLQKANPMGKSVSPQQVPDFLSLSS